MEMLRSGQKERELSIYTKGQSVEKDHDGVHSVYIVRV